MKLFWPSVRTEYPRLSHNRRNSFSSAVWSMSQPVWSKSEGTLDHDELSSWALNQEAHSQELPQDRSRGSQVGQCPTSAVPCCGSACRQSIGVSRRQAMSDSQPNGGRRLLPPDPASWAWIRWYGTAAMHGRSP